jgi:hypothetical protein
MHKKCFGLCLPLLRRRVETPGSGFLTLDVVASPEGFFPLPGERLSIQN